MHPPLQNFPDCAETQKHGVKSALASTYPFAIVCTWGVMARTRVWGSPPLLVAPLARAESWQPPQNPGSPLKDCALPVIIFASLPCVVVLSHIRKRVPGSGGAFGVRGMRYCAQRMGRGRRAQPEHAAAATLLQHSHELQIHRPRSRRAPMAGPRGGCGLPNHPCPVGIAQHSPNSSENITGC